MAVFLIGPESHHKDKLLVIHGFFSVISDRYVLSGGIKWLHLDIYHASGIQWNLESLKIIDNRKTLGGEAS